MSLTKRARQGWRRLVVRWRLALIGLRAIFSIQHPMLVQIVPIRRCNLSCTYCNEYDDHSPAVPLSDMVARIDRLSELGASIVSLSGGEPMLHPELDAIIRRIKAKGMMAELLTNGFFLTEDRIEELNRAGLDRLQISIDNVRPDDVSKKSLKTLDRKLELLAKHAEFDVNINSVLGASIAEPEDAMVIGDRAREFGFSNTVGIIHDHQGGLAPLPPDAREVYRRMKAKSGLSFGPLTRFKDELVEGRSSAWRCRAGGRYLYVCEDGLVHFCSQQRGSPGTPLFEYTHEDIQREFHSDKPCSTLCTVSCVRTLAVLDHWRGRQPHRAALADGLVQIGRVTPLAANSPSLGGIDRAT